MSTLTRYIQAAAGIAQRRIANAWNLSTATADYDDSIPFAAGSLYDSSSIHFSSDGAKMYIINYFSVEEYSLGTAWKLATRSYAATNIFYPKLTDIYSGTFSNDGLTLLLILTNRTMVTYRLGTAWDLSTVQEPVAGSIASTLPGVAIGTSDAVIKPDGTKLYVLGYSNRYIYEYALSTAFDLSTISLTNSIDMSAYTTISPLEGMDFKSDGTELFITSQSYLAKFPLSVAWDISSISTGTTTFGYPLSYTAKGFRVSPAGNYFYVADDLANKIDQYTTATPWVFSSASKTSEANISATANAARSLTFSVDGANVYVASGTTSNLKIVQYALTSPWNVNSISTSGTFDPRVGLGKYLDYTSVGGIAFNDTGNTMFVTSGDEHFVFAYSLSEAWNVQSSTISNTATSIQHLGQMTGNAVGVTISNNGLNVYTASVDNIYQYAMGSYANTASITFSSNVYNPRSGFGSLNGLTIQDGGEAIYTTTFTGRVLIRLPMSTPYQLAYSSSNTTASITSVDRSQGIFINGNNTHLYVNDDTSGTIADLTCNISGTTVTLDIATVGSGYLYLNRYLSDGQRTSDFSGMYFRSDGKRAYFMNSSRYIHLANFSNAWSLASLSGGTTSNTRATGTSTNNGLFFRPNGATYYNMSAGSPYEVVAPYSVSTPWGLESTALSFTLLSADTNMIKVVFSNDGTKMFTLGTSNNKVYAYTLSSAWNVSTATLSTSYSLGSNPWTDLVASSTGKYLFVSTSAGEIYRLTLTTAWDLSTVSTMELNLSLANTYTSGGDFNIKAMHISSAGDKLLIAGSDRMLIQSYTII